jgi:hypothetical protein
MKLLLLLSFYASICASLGGQSIRLEDSSDWWSMNNQRNLGLYMEPIEKRFDTRNFKILNLSLDTLTFAAVASKLGKAPVVERGDASTGRSQICYTSGTSADKIHLVFEFGEGQSSAFYLFRGGVDWSGSNRCVKSSKLTENVSTEIGLRLGLPRVQVEAILGKADVAEGDRIAYGREFYRRATKEEFERSRQEYPESLSDEAAEGKFGSVPVTMELQARFKDSKMNYLYVSTDSLNDN